MFKRCNSWNQNAQHRQIICFSVWSLGPFKGKPKKPNVFSIQAAAWKTRDPKFKLAHTQQICSLFHDYHASLPLTTDVAQKAHIYISNHRNILQLSHWCFFCGNRNTKSQLCQPMTDTLLPESTRRVHFPLRYLLLKVPCLPTHLVSHPRPSFTLQIEPKIDLNLFHISVGRPQKPKTGYLTIRVNNRNFRTHSYLHSCFVSRCLTNSSDISTSRNLTKNQWLAKPFFKATLPRSLTDLEIPPARKNALICLSRNFSFHFVLIFHPPFFPFSFSRVRGCNFISCFVPGLLKKFRFFYLARHGVSISSSITG